MYDYEIIKAGNIETLERKVNLRLESGYQLAGNLIVQGAWLLQPVARVWHKGDE